MYIKEKSFECPLCGEEHTACRCTPKRSRTSLSLHLAEYTKEDSAIKSMILYAKDLRYKRLFDYMADELSSLIRAHVDIVEGCVITFAPRDKERILSSGHDQAKYTAKLVSKRLGIPFVNAIRRISSSEQKKLSFNERRANAEHTYMPRMKKIPSILGKTVIIYDDIMTSGATLQACARVISKMGARAVITVTAARTYAATDRDIGFFTCAK